MSDYTPQIRYNTLNKAVRLTGFTPRSGLLRPEKTPWDGIPPEVDRLRVEFAGSPKFNHALKWSIYRRTAQRKKTDFNIDYWTFCHLLEAPCVYCGQEADPENGVDRVMSRYGYERWNVVPCCKACNFMKRDLTLDDFLSRARRIASLHPGSGASHP